MKTRRGACLRVVLVVGLTVLGLAAAHTAGSAATWTVMVYLDADNDLEGAGIDDVNEMEAAPASAEIKVVVQMDRIPGHDSSNGNWTDTRRFRITHDSNPAVITSPQVGGFLGELNMGDPQTLVDFVQWTIAGYPADHYLLILWDHGSGWKKGTSLKPRKGIAFDDTDDDYLTTVEMSSALQTIAGSLGRNLDIVACDACLMQMAEVAYEIRASADYYVASEETIPWDGYPYDDWLTALASSPSMSAAELSALLVDTYVDSYNGGSQGEDYVTLSAVDLSKIAEVAGVAGDFGTALGNAMDSCCQHIITYVSGTQSYTDSDYKDLYHLAELMQENVPDDGVIAAAGAMQSAVTVAVIANRSVGSMLGDSHGISIYYPYPYPYLPSYGELSFAADTVWDEYISADPPCDAILPDAYEPDGSPAQASVITTGTPQPDHWMDVGGDQDWAGLNAEAGRYYTAETRHLGYWADTVLCLYDTDGATLLAVDDDSGSEWCASLIDWRCPTSGTYYLMVEDYWPDIFGLQTHYDLYLTEHQFSDVLPSYWAFTYIEACYHSGIVGGYDGDTYRPTSSVDRAAMAVFISRALAGGDAGVPAGPVTPTFPDVLTDHWAYRYVEYAYSNHIVGGYAEGYRPAAVVDRGQMAVFVARAMVDPTGDEGLAGYTPPATPSFPDVPPEYWSYLWIEYLYEHGIVGGYDDGYRPGETVNRAQMAVYVQRAFGLPM